ncbi:MAG: putative porin [Bryobacteraceae bacterium]
MRETLKSQGEMLRSLAACTTSSDPAPKPAQLPAIASSALPAQPAAPAPSVQEKPATSVAGFRFSGDFRYRLDLQLRSGNEFTAPLQNARGRYRLRLNIDKDLAKGLSTHTQLSTGPLVNEITNDQDFASLGVKHPFSISEAWMRYGQGGFNVRGGRMEEVFADGSRFLWDDDIRFNGFDARQRVSLASRTALEFRAAAYILTNPNTPVVPAGSPFLAIGHAPGQKVRDAVLFHPGAVLTTASNGWRHQLTGTMLIYRNADQIQLASSAAGFGTLASNGIGVTLSGPITAAGNAVISQGAPLLAARHWQIVHSGWRSDYPELNLGKRTVPFYAEFQTALNAGTGSDRFAWEATASLGSARRRGGVRGLYQYSYKQANSMISQFTDDDLGTGTGVNIRVNTFRVDVGLTRFLEWHNILFVQDPIAGQRPGFFVPIPKGANTTFRYQGQLAFSF